MNKPMHRVAQAILGAAAVTVVVAGAASAADAADNQKLVGSYSFVDDATCADPVQVAGDYDETVHTFYDNDGQATRLSFTGKVTTTYTDLANGHVYSPNSSGPATVDLSDGQTILRGSSGAVFTDTGLLATHGRLVLDADGGVISITGTQAGVCATLGTTSG
jgi:hypothetical protein